uniref:DUF1639 family protein n=1 Tax=Oryza brachyantha TaxID=4533 RepID=J3KW47_ORYBR
MVISAEPPPPPPPDPVADGAAVEAARRRPAVTPASSVSPPPERRAARARADALDRPRFSVTLTSEEIEEDVYAVTGARPRRRPRRRPRPVQKQLDLLFPGAWLAEITVESYRVPDDRSNTDNYSDETVNK